MHIRLTVLAAPTGGQTARRACDVLVTAPSGTALAAVASGLATAAAGPDGAAASGSVVLYAGRERLDPQRSTLGEPPLTDGAVLALQAPAEEAAAPEGAPARLHVVAGPDAGGVHLLHPGDIRVGRSADADVPLDDPDVSRLHCVVTVAEDGRVRVADPGSTNGTTLDGREVGPRPVRLAPGALLRVGESALRVTPGPPSGPATGSLPTAPDGEGRLRVSLPGRAEHEGTAARPVVPGARRPSWAEQGEGGTETGRRPGQTREDEQAYGSGPTPPYSPGRGAAPHHAPAPAPSLSARPTPPRGTQVPPGAQEAPRRRGGIGAWARRLTGGGRADSGGTASDRAEAPMDPAAPGSTAPPTAGGTEAWPDPAAVLLTALDPGPRLWERAPGHPEALVVRLGTAERAELAAVPVTVGLREAGSLGLAGPRPRLLGLARSVLAQLTALHAPADLEVVLISADRGVPLERRVQDWGWLGWLPHLRPAHGQDCRLLLAYDADQAHARVAELTRRLDNGPLGPGWAQASPMSVAEAAARAEAPYTVVVVDGDPGPTALRETLARLAAAGAAAGIHLVCLAETEAASPRFPVAAAYEAACGVSAAFRECGAVGLLSGDVATALRLMRTAGGRPAGHGTVAAVDAVSGAWAERFARALAPLRAEGPGGAGRAAATALPRSARLLDELELARATPASLMARWASAPDGTAVLGRGPHGPLQVDLTREGPHLLVEGPAGSGRTELLRSVAASLAAAARPDRLGLLLVDGAGGERGEGLGPCTDLPHVAEHLVASDPVRMRAFAQALGAELKRRAELLEAGAPPPKVVGPRAPEPRPADPAHPLFPRLVVLVDDLDALVAPALGSPGRPAAGSVVRALEAVAREGERLGVHLVAATARPDRTAATEAARRARLRVVLDAPAAPRGPDDPAPGRGRLTYADGGAATPFQSGRVTGRIPRTSTLRPTVVPLEWDRMGDPPTRRPVRELGNGPTDLALLASALDRAARSLEAAPVPTLR